MALDPVIFRTPILDASGKLTREWIRFFQELQAATGTVQNIQNTTAIQGQASSFDDVPTRDVTAEITNALLAAMGEPSGKAPADDSMIDWTPANPAPVDLLTALHAQDTFREPPYPDALAAFLLDSSDPLGAAAAAVAAIPNSSSTSTGLLTSADWSTFNGKAGLTANTFTGQQSFQGGVVGKTRLVSSTDTATATDHTLLFSTGGFTETLPASPSAGRILYLINTAASAVTISGNGKNIWNAGTSTATVSLAANSTMILQYDGVADVLWRQVK